MNEAGIIVYGVGLVYASACVPAETETAAVEAEVNRLFPTGVGPWQISGQEFRTGEPNPCECDTDPSRLHYLLNC